MPEAAMHICEATKTILILLSPYCKKSIQVARPNTIANPTPVMVAFLDGKFYETRGKKLFSSINEGNVKQ